MGSPRKPNPTHRRDATDGVARIEFQRFPLLYFEHRHRNEDTMRIDSLLICRANGKVYEKLRISELRSSANLISIVRGDDSGASSPVVPARLYQLENIGSHEKTAIAVYPIMSVSIGSFVIAEFSEQEEIISQECHEVDFSTAKWKSRLNYRVKSSECSSIRLIDERVQEYGDVSIKPITAIGTDSHLLLRIEIVRPSTPDSIDGKNIAIDCVNLSGKSVLDGCTHMGTSFVDSKFGDSSALISHTYTVRVPWNQGDLYFYSWVKGHPCTTFMRIIHHNDYESILAQSDSILYRDAYSDPYYGEWFKSHQPTPFELDRQRSATFDIRPLFSIVVPLYNTPLCFFSEMVSSVAAQTYPNWELILVNASPDNAELSDFARQASANETRIHIETLEDNKGISLNTNAGIDVAKGDFVCFLDHDDLIEPNALYEYARAINEHPDTDLLYCDEDKLTPEGKLVHPFFKPDFSIDLLRNNNYICHFLTIRKSLLETILPNTAEYDGSQDYNLILRSVEHARHIHHVPLVMYHWRISETSTAGNADEKPYATIAGIKALEEHLQRVGLSAKVLREDRPFTYKVIYDVPDDMPLVSIIIPTKDHIDLLKTCISSIEKISTYPNYEILIVENNSTEQETFDFYDQVSRDSDHTRLRVLTWEHEFNFSKIINFAAQHANGQYLILLNNDTEVITPNWIETMLGIASRKEVGAVGVKLYYPDETLQHAGVGFGDDVPAHYFSNLPRGKHGYFCFDDAQRNVSAVTAACLMTRKDVFLDIDGFNENYGVAYNDVDYCLRLRDHGYLITYTPEVELYHYESISRGFDKTGVERARYIGELARIHMDWAPFFAEGDPYYTPNLRRSFPDFCYYHF